MYQEMRDVVGIAVATSVVACLAGSALRRPRPARARHEDGRRRGEPSPAGRTGHGRRALLSLVALMLLPLFSTAVLAQTVRYGVVMDQPRGHLDSLWTNDPHQVERAFCVTNYSTGVYHVSREPVQEDSIFRVFAVSPASVTGAGPSSVDFECPAGVPELHTHTPTTCMGDDIKTCVTGGLNAYSCQPSRRDLQKLVQRGDPFAVIQCDRRDFRFYYPTEYVPNVIASAGERTRSSSKPEGLRAVPPILRPPAKKTP